MFAGDLTSFKDKVNNSSDKTSKTRDSIESVISTASTTIEGSKNKINKKRKIVDITKNDRSAKKEKSATAQK